MNYIVKHNQSKKYFCVNFLLTSIASVTLTKNKTKATVFSSNAPTQTNIDGVIMPSWQTLRRNEFSAFLYFHKFTPTDITIEETKNPETPLIDLEQSL